MALTAEQIQQLIRQYQNSGDGAYYDPTLDYQIMTAAPQGQQSGGIQNGEWASNPNNEYRVTQGPMGEDRTKLNGRDWQQYGGQGAPTSNGTWQGLTPESNDWADIAKAMAIVGTVGYGGSMLAGAAGGAAGGAGGSAAFTPATFGTTGAIGGFPAATGTGFGFTELGAGAAGGAAGGAMGASGGSAGGAGAVAPAAGGSSLFGGSGAAGMLSGASGLMGPAATLLGGVLGSQGNKQEQNSTKTMDPRLDGPVFGAGGIVPQAQGLLQQQMTPERQQQWLDMQKTGQGLLSQPIAGNGYAQFAGRKF